MIRLYVMLQVRLAEVMDPDRRDERGQGTLEYVGMIAVAAILVVAVLQATKTIDLGEFFSKQVKKVTDKAG